MIRIKRLMAVLATVLLSVELSGCAGTLDLRPAELTEKMTAENGIVLGSITRVDGVMSYSSYYFHLRKAKSDKVVRLRVWVNGMSPNKVDAVENGLLRSIAANPVAPGEYEFFRLSAFSTNGYVSQTVTYTLKEPLPLTVEAGKAYYIGAAAPVPKIGENFMGVDEIKGLNFLLLDNADDDIALAREIYPNLPEVDASIAEGFATFDGNKLLRLTKAINPEEKFWDKAAWERVKELEAPEDASSPE